VGNILFLWNIILRGIIFAVIVEKCYMWITVHINTPLVSPSPLLYEHFSNIICYDMSEVAEIEALQLEIEGLRAQLKALMLGDAASVLKRQRMFRL
jgi:hypothetical protein